MVHAVIVGLGFGDEGKGATVDWLASTGDYKAVIRYNGGPQAAHNVVTPDGRHHTFAQFGSASFLGVPTYLSQYMLVNPFNLAAEGEHLTSLGLGPWEDLVTISEDALLITPLHVEANRLREDLRSGRRHGSTGEGVGEARWFNFRFPESAPKMRDLVHHDQLSHKLLDIYMTYTSEFGDEFKNRAPDMHDLMDSYQRVAEHLNIVRSSYIHEFIGRGDCIFEGAQGVLLDELYGFNPHTTWTNTTQHNARTLLRGAPAEVYGLTRTYQTRHGAGPFPTEDWHGFDWSQLEEPHNEYGHYQGGWRRGALDLSLLDYAIEVNDGIDHLVVNHVDALQHGGLEMTRGYCDYEGKRPSIWLHANETIGAPYDLEQSIDLGREMSRVVPFGYRHVVTENDLSDVLTDVTGIRPSVFSYGPTREDRVVQNDLTRVD